MVLEPPVWGSVGYVCPTGQAATAGEQGDNATSPVEYDGAGISWAGEGGKPLVVG